MEYSGLSVVDDATAQEAGQYVVDKYNASLKPFEKPVKFISACVIFDDIIQNFRPNPYDKYYVKDNATA